MFDWNKSITESLISWKAAVNYDYAFYTYR